MSVESLEDRVGFIEKKVRGNISAIEENKTVIQADNSNVRNIESSMDRLEKKIVDDAQDDKFTSPVNRDDSMYVLRRFKALSHHDKMYCLSCMNSYL